MSFGDFTGAFDTVVTVLPATWIGAAGDPIYAPLLPDSGANFQSVLELFGSDSLAATAIGGNYTHWSLVIGSPLFGNGLGQYHELRTASVPQIGSVAVPVVTAPYRWTGALFVRLDNGTVKPTTAAGASFRLKGSRVPIQDFREDRLASFAPRETAIDRLISGVGRIFRG